MINQIDLYGKQKKKNLSLLAAFSYKQQKQAMQIKQIFNFQYIN